MTIITINSINDTLTIYQYLYKIIVKCENGYRDEYYIASVFIKHFVKSKKICIAFVCDLDDCDITNNERIPLDNNEHTYDLYYIFIDDNVNNENNIFNIIDKQKEYIKDTYTDYINIYLNDFYINYVLNNDCTINVLDIFNGYIDMNINIDYFNKGLTDKYIYYTESTTSVLKCYGTNKFMFCIEIENIVNIKNMMFVFNRDVNENGDYVYECVNIDNKSHKTRKMIVLPKKYHKYIIKKYNAHDTNYGLLQKYLIIEYYRKINILI